VIEEAPKEVIIERRKPESGLPRLSARERIASLVDEASFKEQDRFLHSLDPLRFVDQASYQKQLLSASTKTKEMDALVAGKGMIEGRTVLLAAFDFSFFGGSMGSVVGEKLARLFRRGAREKLPVVVVTSSGGARIQEGMVALSMMAKTALAVGKLQEAGVPFICLLADPTMGGVFVSFASLADVLLAEEGARVGFVGARVHTQALNESAPAGSAEFALEHGLIDAIVKREEQRATLTQILDDLTPARERVKPQVVAEVRYVAPKRSAWSVVELARRKDRPSGRQVAEATFDRLFWLRGDRMGKDDRSVITALARLGDEAVVVVAQDRHAANGGKTSPSGFTKAQRAFMLAERLHLPVVTFVDTPGVAADQDAEAHGIAFAIAHSLGMLSRLKTPVVNVVVGEGGSGGALGFAVGDRTLMLENSIFSVISPEGAASILCRDASLAEGVAERLRLTAGELMKLGLADRVLEERPALHVDVAPTANLLADVLGVEIAKLAEMSIGELLRKREKRYGRMGVVAGRRHIFLTRTLPGVGMRLAAGAAYKLGEWFG
jgi:acetyl-CoA carboxylase carboxyl transferase subunit beta